VAISARPGLTRGAYRDRHEREAGCGGRGSVGAEVWMQGEATREHFTSRKTYGAEAYGKTVWFWHPWLVSSCRWRIRSNRIGWAIEPAAMEARGIRLQGEHGISRQTIAQGMPACSDCTCMLVCASHYIMHTGPRVQRAPGIPCTLW